MDKVGVIIGRTVMSNQKRKEVILALLVEKGKVLVNELAKDMNVSEKTIRRDLDKMEKEGLLVRSHGGAVRPDMAELSVEQEGLLPSHEQRVETFEEGKKESFEEPMKENSKKLNEEADKSNKVKTGQLDEGLKKHERMVESSKPDWLVRAMENAKSSPVTKVSTHGNQEKAGETARDNMGFVPRRKVSQGSSKDIKIRQSGNTIKPIGTLRDINLMDLEKSISPETLAELMKLVDSEIQNDTRAAVELEKPVMDKRLEYEEPIVDEELEYEESSRKGWKYKKSASDEELEDEGVEDEEPKHEKSTDVEEPIEDELEDEELPPVEGARRKKSYGAKKADYQLEMVNLSGEQRVGRVPKVVPWQETKRRTRDSYKRKVAEFYEGHERIKESERPYNQERKNKKNKSIEAEREAKLPEGKNRTKTSSKGKSKSQEGKITNKPSTTMKRILDWLHIIVALAIFIGGIILAFYIIQSNRAQHMIINEGNSQYESIVYDDLSFLILTDDGLLESVHLK